MSPGSTPSAKRQRGGPPNGPNAFEDALNRFGQRPFVFEERNDARVRVKVTQKWACVRGAGKTVQATKQWR
jgi:hypothetical protein